MYTLDVIVILRFSDYLKKSIKTGISKGIIIAVNTADRINATELYAPILGSFRVRIMLPITWLAAPIESPVAILLFTLINLSQLGPSKAPEKPAIIIAKAVMELLPDNCSVNEIPIGVVTDFNDKEIAISC